jgi:hypothetical protein
LNSYVLWLSGGPGRLPGPQAGRAAAALAPPSQELQEGRRPTSTMNASRPSPSSLTLIGGGFLGSAVARVTGLCSRGAAGGTPRARRAALGACPAAHPMQCSA